MELRRLAGESSREVCFGELAIRRAAWMGCARGRGLHRAAAARRIVLLAPPYDALAALALTRAAPGGGYAARGAGLLESLRSLVLFLSWRVR